ncbi:RNA-guided endonuclease TnpB family protein [Candidatus Nitrosotenuis chungbukensis]|uniref:RNA-guided endonuclease InsQ/TnpB family protein n=1 Tax=Candidatus Nitrosotenuis chungbukensis TaxID=1353246 RepID=UPI0009777068|nr:RNA-guided endonuclease TnpB family protein [Candidatus Nitrosotenuis chungbukensis]WKT58870.1 RNA-guided endonuclease TnpB family protein [Candidatus Nitrosotenuis chungbukensis]
MFVRNFKFRLYPSYQQQKKLQNNIETCRWVYNKFVKFAQRSFLTRNDMNYMLTDLKQSEPWLYNYHAKMLQMVSTQLDGAQKAIIRLRKNGHKTGGLRFATHIQYRTFIYNQSGYKLEKHGHTDLLWLSKIGYMEIRKHREITGNVKQIIISKSRSGKWYAIATCENDNNILPKIDFKKAVGLDVGIKNFVYDSHGCVTPNPLNFKKSLKLLAKIQRKITRRQKGSNKRKKAVRWYQIIHERIVNRRRDFQHKLSTHYAKNNDVIFVERLEKLNMVKNHHLARSILDSSWGSFCNMLEYKCKILVEVPAKNTSVDCSRCSNIVPKSLAVRIHRCNVCGLVLDRDQNAGINILRRGLEIFRVTPNLSHIVNLPQELREVTPVEIRKWSMKQEKATKFIGSSSLKVELKNLV